MTTPKGVLVALVTPMNPDGSLNERELRNQVNRQIASGIHGIFCLGTNGEFYALDEAEKLEVIRIVVEEANGRVPVSAGVGCVTTAQTVRLAKAAAGLGADILSVITPYFAQVNQRELIRHYETVATAVDVGLILYNIPARTGINIAHTTLTKLSATPNIVGIKDSSANFDNTLRYLESTNRRFPVLAGNDSMILSTLQAGGAGAIAATANLFPRCVASIYDKFIAGDIEGATRLQDGLRAIRDCFALGNPNSVTKRIVNLLGHPVGDVRAPFGADYDEWDETILSTLETHYQDWR